MKQSAWRAQWAVGCLLLFLALATAAAGCVTGPSDQASTTDPEASTSLSSIPVTSQSVTTSTLPEMLSDYDRELAKTATIQHQFAAYLSDQQASDDDPRIGIIYGLRARTQAITCRKALSTNDLASADAAMKEVYITLNLSKEIPSGTAAQALTDARDIVATVGAPSDNPDQAAVLLDQFIALLAPLLDEATAILGTTIST